MKVQELEIMHFESVKELINLCLDFVNTEHKSTIEGKIYFPEGHKNLVYYLTPFDGIESFITLKHIHE